MLEGINDGNKEGDALGTRLGSSIGAWLGRRLGLWLGKRLGDKDGIMLERRLGEELRPCDEAREGSTEARQARRGFAWALARLKTQQQHWQKAWTYAW
jgi:hypothetical protein